MPLTYTYNNQRFADGGRRQVPQYSTVPLSSQVPNPVQGQVVSTPQSTGVPNAPTMIDDPMPDYQPKAGFRTKPGVDLGTPPQNEVPSNPNASVLNTGGPLVDTRSVPQTYTTIGTVPASEVSSQFEVDQTSQDPRVTSALGNNQYAGHALTGQQINNQFGGISQSVLPDGSLAYDAVPQVESVPGANVQAVTNTREVGGIQGSVRTPEVFAFAQGGLVPDPMPQYKGRGGRV